MSGFVTVRVWARGDVPVRAGATAGPGAGALVLNVDAASGAYVVAARASDGAGRDGGSPGCPGCSDGRDHRPGACVDEHFAVDTDGVGHDLSGDHAGSPAVRAGWRRQQCADVRYASRPRTPAEAARLLADLMAAHPGCGLAALPLIDGGWAATAGGPDRRVVVLRPRLASVERLFASCLHGWLVAGHSLEELADARIEPPAGRRSAGRVRAAAVVRPSLP